MRAKRTENTETPQTDVKEVLEINKIGSPRIAPWFLRSRTVLPC